MCPDLGESMLCWRGRGVTLDVSNDLLRRQVTLIGSWTFSTIGQADCARYIADRGIDLDRLFSHRWRLDQAEEAYRVFDTQTSGKGVIHPAKRCRPEERTWRRWPSSAAD